MRQKPTNIVLMIDSSKKIVIVRSSYYEDLVTLMEEGAKSILMEAGLPEENIVTVAVPGAFEIPHAAKQMLNDVDGVIAIGMIVEGETYHAQEVARACTDGLMQLQVFPDAPPIVHEVLYVKNIKQAEERCKGNGNKGEEAARTLLQLLSLQTDTSIE